jgi:hypothetical protein
MAYMGTTSFAAPEGLGCGGSCGCSSCRKTALGEWYESDSLNEAPATAPSTVIQSTACAISAGRRTRSRCRTEHACPAIPDLMCIRSVEGVPFEYLTGTRSEQSLRAPVTISYTAKVTPPIARSLSDWVHLMRSVRMPVDIIVSLGSHNCRCISNTDTLSNHSIGDALDIAGVRWGSPRPAGAALPSTLVHNWQNAAERRLLRRMDACLRLTFPAVLDYHDSHHRDHFHVDNNRGRGFRMRGPSFRRFVQECLGVALNRTIPITGQRDVATAAALREFGRLPASTAIWQDAATLLRIENDLFRSIAEGASS